MTRTKTLILGTTLALALGLAGCRPPAQQCPNWHRRGGRGRRPAGRCRFWHHLGHHRRSGCRGRDRQRDWQTQRRPRPLAPNAKSTTSTATTTTTTNASSRAAHAQRPDPLCQARAAQVHKIAAMTSTSALLPLPPTPRHPRPARRTHQPDCRWRGGGAPRLGGARIGG